MSQTMLVKGHHHATETIASNHRREVLSPEVVGPFILSATSAVLSFSSHKKHQKAQKVFFGVSSCFLWLSFDQRTSCLSFSAPPRHCVSQLLSSGAMLVFQNRRLYQN
jgi:hypothetical protein